MIAGDFTKRAELQGTCDPTLCIGPVLGTPTDRSARSGLASRFGWDLRRRSLRSQRRARSVMTSTGPTALPPTPAANASHAPTHISVCRLFAIPAKS